jgi:hypothetical protein
LQFAIDGENNKIIGIDWGGCERIDPKGGILGTLAEAYAVRQSHRWTTKKRKLVKTNYFIKFLKSGLNNTTTASSLLHYVVQTRLIERKFRNTINRSNNDNMLKFFAAPH